MLKASLDKLKSSLFKTKNNLFDKLIQAVSGGRQLDEKLLFEIEEILLAADVGLPASGRIIAVLKEKAAKAKNLGQDAIMELLKEEIQSILNKAHTASGKSESAKLRVILIVGVNGTGKTTSIGKLAFKLKQEGKRVLIAACDTFRAAAQEQLAIWAERAGAELVNSQPEADPASVAFDAVKSGLARQFDTLIIDTAGRLHTKVNLMEELKKIKRVVAKIDPGFPQDVLLVLDSTTGQNALSHVKLFGEAVSPTGIILTKLDGTAKGGVVIAIAEEYGIPVRYVGLGEQIEDLEEFDPAVFTEALLSC